VPAFAKSSPDEDKHAQAVKTVAQAFDTALKSAKHGPASVAMLNEASLSLPKGYQFIPKEQAGPLLEAMGNQEGDNLLGLVLSDQDDASWMVVARYENAGYIKDDDAKNWNADELLKSLKEGTEEGNEERRERGLTEFEVVGWVEKPTYDAANKRLVWSCSSRDKGEHASPEQGINYNTYALGREGYISMNLVTDLGRINDDKPVAKALLGALTFNAGKRYSDFKPGSDKVAEYGLAALVAGVAAKKLGLFALAAALVAKSFKLIAVAVVGGFLAAKKFLFGQKEAPAELSATVPQAEQMGPTKSEATEGASEETPQP
jgi:uncharacterized membrane-anchored protein